MEKTLSDASDAESVKDLKHPYVEMVADLCKELEVTKKDKRIMSQVLVLCQKIYECEIMRPKQTNIPELFGGIGSLMEKIQFILERLDGKSKNKLLSNIDKVSDKLSKKSSKSDNLQGVGE